MTVHHKLMQARLALQGTELKKSGHNKFAGYYYFELGDFLPAIQRIFAETGLSGVVSFGADIATLTITDMDDMSSIVITSPMSSAALKGCHEVQNLGAVQTYIRRYLWVTAMEIVEHDALDSTTGSDKGLDKGTSPDKGKKAEPIQIKGVTPLAGALEMLPEDERPYIRELSDDVVKAFGNSPKAAHERIEIESLDSDQKAALWSLLPSPVRSGLKKVAAEQKVAHAA